MRDTTRRKQNSVMKLHEPSRMSAAPARIVVAMPSLSTTWAPFTQTPVASSLFTAWASAASMSARMPSR